ncbi:MAG: tRNA (adenosine(37)-N6)-threonylcarbamoyltransferase complex dimerization subunit type 1 TsaB [Candidatus Competibacteraceae bacterium]|nr:tRNA (adenosine(37)-N6)-threonylcarbamoyltransferase complex dimerization subunit type 1 TsaB [Candidatus Competibacteraceae bacterium]
MILHIETSSTVCSVALSQHAICLAHFDMHDPNMHSSHLSVFIDELMDKCSVSIKQLQAVAVSVGPGSYTGLRIGLSTAKGICYATDAHLIAVPTLHAMADLFLQRNIVSSTSYIIPVMDARRQDVYTAVFSAKPDMVIESQAIEVNKDSFQSYLHHHPCHFIGNASNKVQQLISPHPNATFHHGIMPSSMGMIRIAEKMMSDKKFADLAYLEPIYRSM